MAKHNQKGRSKNPDGKYVQIFNGFRKGTAWRSLSPYAQILYIEIKSHYNGSNNGEITLSVREAAKNLNYSKNAAEKAFKDLVNRGFIKNRCRGYLGADGKGVASKWELTELGFKGAVPTQEYKNWKPSQ